MVLLSGLATGSGTLEISVVPAINRESSAFISDHAYRPSLVQLVLTLDDFILRLSYICGKREYEILCNTFLHADPGGRVGVIAADHGIDLQAGNACQLA
jgi:hypothetical protein